MYIREVELKNFRNYEYLNLKFNENVNFIIGNNAQGKTNLLESIFICSMGKSFRTSKDPEMIGFEKDKGYCSKAAISCRCRDNSKKRSGKIHQSERNEYIQNV